MKQNSNITEILRKLKEFKRKYYLNKIVGGLLFNAALFLVLLLFTSWLEYSLQMDSRGRTIVFGLSSVLLVYSLIRYLFIPLYHLINNGKHLSNAEAAKQIGKFFPEIKDKLLNFIQLNDLSAQENSLIRASINQKSDKLSVLDFKKGINIRKSNKAYLPYVAIPALVIVAVLMFSPNMITEGSYRIIKFNEDFIPTAPFTFSIENPHLQGFKGDNFTLLASINGKEIPSDLYLSREGLKQKFEKVSSTEFKFTFKNLQQDLNFNLQAAGFNSQSYELTVFEKPRIQEMNITLTYPKYIKTSKERIDNSGNLIIPEGTKADWLIKSNSSDKITFAKQSDSIAFTKTGDASFLHSTTINRSSPYQLHLFNTEANYNQKINYSIEVIKDKYPNIKLSPINDSTYYKQVAIAGEISDDYGFSRLRIIYNEIKDGLVIKSGRIPLSFDRSILNQKYFKVWRVDSLLQNDDTRIEYYVEVADNDEINGAKSSKSATYSIQLPDKEAVAEEINKTSQSTENQIDKSIQSSKNTEQKLEELEEILKTKRKLNWEDKKLLEDIIKEQEARQNELQNIKNKLNENQARRDRFNKQDPELNKKAEQLESMMEEMLKDENQELMEKIKSLMQKQNQSDDFRESVEDLKKQEKNKLKEMKRLMELFKRMEIQYDMNEVGEKLEELQKDQKSLSEKNESSKEQDSEQEPSEFDTEEDKEKAIQEQKEINKNFEKLQEQLREIEKRNQSLNQPNSLQDTKEQESEIDLSQQNSLQKLQDNKKGEAGKEQQKSAEEMKKMSEMLSSMQMNMEMEMLKENIDDLRDIVDNLLKLSFRQETLMKNFREVNPSDPRFITLSEKQLAMQDDAKIVEDSLTSLAERVFQLKNFINKELDQMNESMESSVKALRERQNDKAIGEQQFAMTAMNNLALMLDDVLQQMQMQMKSSMGMGQQSKGNQQSPSLSDMQKSLNQKTKELSQGQKSGRQFSEKLGELAAEQAKIRKMMEELEKGMGKKEGDNGDDGKEGGGGNGSIAEEMEKIEEDLVNKKLDRRVIERQEKIVTKLLESEKARAEQEEKDERKGETATEYEKKRIPNAFEEYIKEKQKEIEQLRNVPPNFTPYYKNEINKYYNRLKSKEQLIQ